MTSSEAARKHLKELKGKPLKEKLQHIFTYYGFKLAILAGVLIFVISYTVHLVTMKDSVLNITCLGATVTQKDADAFASGFAEHAGIDQEQYEVDISTNFASYEQGGGDGTYELAEIMVALIAAQEVDALVSDATTLIPYMYQRMFADLTEVMSAEQQERYKDYFLYADNAIVQQLKDMSVVEELPEFPDPTKPELMQEPIPIAVQIPEDTQFHQLCFSGRDTYAVYGIAVNAVNLENTLAFLDYIME